MAPSRYARLGYRALGGMAERAAKSNVHLSLSLQRAHIRMRPEMYLGYAYLNILVAAGAGIAMVAMLGVLGFAGVVEMPLTVFVLLVPMPMVFAVSAYLLSLLGPELRAQKRARDIDANLPYALNFIATMAAAGVTPEKVFASLARQPIYGEVAQEAAWINRDIKHLGADVVHALTAAIDRSPSVRFQDFLQGMIASLTSGGSLKDYLTSKSEQYMFENRQAQKKFLESLGLLAESFVTVVVAAPLFIMVLLSVMVMMGNNPRQTILLGYLIILVVLPCAQLAFGLVIKQVTPEV